MQAAKAGGGGGGAGINPQSLRSLGVTYKMGGLSRRLPFAFTGRLQQEATTGYLLVTD